MVKREKCRTHNEDYHLYITGYKDYLLGPFEDMEDFLDFNSTKQGIILIPDFKMNYNCPSCKIEKKKHGIQFMRNNNVARDHLLFKKLEAKNAQPNTQ